MTSTLILLHGLGQAPKTWERVQEAAPPGWTVVAPWLRGMAPEDPSTFSIEGASSQVGELIEAASDRPVAVCGLSLGAMVATHLAAARPGLVDRLVLSAPQARPPRPLLLVQSVLMRALPEKQFVEAGVSREKFIQALLAAGRTDLSPRLASIGCATLVLVGTRDRINLPAARRVHRAVQGSHFMRLPGGHALNSEPAFVNAVWRFLTTQPATR